MMRLPNPHSNYKAVGLDQDPNAIQYQTNRYAYVRNILPRIWKAIQGQNLGLRGFSKSSGKLLPPKLYWPRTKDPLFVRDMHVVSDIFNNRQLLNAGTFEFFIMRPERGALGEVLIKCPSTDLDAKKEALKYIIEELSHQELVVMPFFYTGTSDDEGDEMTFGVFYRRVDGKPIQDFRRIEVYEQTTALSSRYVEFIWSYNEPGRLWRIPFSLTVPGYAVVPIEPSEIDDFDPTTDADPDQILDNEAIFDKYYNYFHNFFDVSREWTGDIVSVPKIAPPNIKRRSKSWKGMVRNPPISPKSVYDIGYKMAYHYWGISSDKTIGALCDDAWESVTTQYPEGVKEYEDEFVGGFYSGMLEQENAESIQDWTTMNKQQIEDAINFYAKSEIPAELEKVANDMGIDYEKQIAEINAEQERLSEKEPEITSEEINAEQERLSEKEPEITSEEINAEQGELEEYESGNQPVEEEGRIDKFNRASEKIGGISDKVTEKLKSFGGFMKNKLESFGGFMKNKIGINPFEIEDVLDTADDLLVDEWNDSLIRSKWISMFPNGPTNEESENMSWEDIENAYPVFYNYVINERAGELNSMYKENPSYTTINWTDKEGDIKSVTVQLLGVKHERLVDPKSIVWRDRNGKPIKKIRKTQVDGKWVYLMSGDTKDAWVNGDIEADGETLVEVPKEDRISYEVDEGGKEKPVTPFESNLKKGGIVEFDKLIPAEELENYMYDSVYEITATEEEMWDLYQFAKYLVDNNVIAVSNDVVASNSFNLSAGIINATIDEKKGTFSLQLRRVTQKFDPIIDNGIPSGPIAPKIPEARKRSGRKVFNPHSEELTGWEEEDEYRSDVSGDSNLQFIKNQLSALPRSDLIEALSDDEDERDIEGGTDFESMSDEELIDRALERIQTYNNSKEVNGVTRYYIDKDGVHFVSKITGGPKIKDMPDYESAKEAELEGASVGQTYSKIFDGSWKMAYNPTSSSGPKIAQNEVEEAIFEDQKKYESFLRRASGEFILPNPTKRLFEKSLKSAKKGETSYRGRPRKYINDKQLDAFLDSLLSVETGKEVNELPKSVLNEWINAKNAIQKVMENTTKSNPTALVPVLISSGVIGGFVAEILWEKWKELRDHPDVKSEFKANPGRYYCMVCEKFHNEGDKEFSEHYDIAKESYEEYVANAMAENPKDRTLKVLLDEVENYVNEGLSISKAIGRVKREHGLSTKKKDRLKQMYLIRGGDDDDVTISIIDGDVKVSTDKSVNLTVKDYDVQGEHEEHFNADSFGPYDENIIKTAGKGKTFDITVSLVNGVVDNVSGEDVSIKIKDYNMLSDGEIREDSQGEYKLQEWNL